MPSLRIQEMESSLVLLNNKMAFSLILVATNRLLLEVLECLLKTTTDQVKDIAHIMGVEQLKLLSKTSKKVGNLLLIDHL